MSFYHELKDGEIRLLTVEPLVQKWSETELTPTIRCQITVASLSERPEYFALSYTWGPAFPGYHYRELKLQGESHVAAPADAPVVDAKVICNGLKILVGSNLHDFLLRCAMDKEESFRRPMWIDALCIDQSNLPERSHQVQQMAEIYKSASQVVVWLGPAIKDVQYADELIKELASTSPEERRRRARPTELGVEYTDILCSIEHWTALAGLYESNWFSRAWIIQEIAFARAIIVLCGSYSISWEALTEVSHFLATSVWTNYFKDTALLNTHNQAVTRWHNMPARLAATRREWLLASWDGLLYALIRGRKSKCQDPRDKVYSQLKLGNANIFPSYKASVAEVYITAAKYVLDTTDNLLLLTCAEGPDFQSVPGLPSWVPDWSVTKVVGLGVTGYYSFNAAGKVPRNFSIEETGEHPILRVQATKVATIADMAETKEEIQDFSRPTKLWDLVAELPQIYRTGESRDEVLWRTLMTNRSNEQNLVEVQYPASQTLGDSFRYWVQWKYLIASRTRSGTSRSTFPKSNNDTLSDERTIKALIERVQTSTTNEEEDIANRAALFQTHYSHAMLLRPFRTFDGLFGLGTQSLRQGDDVWVVPGCRVPLIFRKLEGSTAYRLVGGAYVHGIMDCQVLQRKDLKFEMVDLI